MAKTLRWLAASAALFAGYAQPVRGFRLGGSSNWSPASMLQDVHEGKEAIDVKRHLRLPRAATISLRATSESPAEDADAPASIFDLNPSFFSGKKVLVRLDLNVPTQESEGKVQIADDSRLQATLPTLRFLLDANAKVIVISHLGDPKPEQKSEPQFSMQILKNPLSEMLNVPVHFMPSSEGTAVQEAAATLKEGELLLLENSRFTPAEKANDVTYSDFLASLADVFVFDAFGTAHRKHATTVGAPLAFKKAGKPALMGLLMKTEVDAIESAAKSPVRPVAWIVGGLKVSSKAALLASLINKSVKGDALLLGGCMALTFLKAKGMDTGASIVEDSEIETAQSPPIPCMSHLQRILEMAAKKGVEVILPKDFLLSNAVSKDAPLLGVCTAEEGVPPGLVALDQGPATNEFFSSRILKAKTIVWNGPMGLAESPAFSSGTAAVAQAAGEATLAGASSVVGGGDSVAAVKKIQKIRPLQLSHLSTGGGATLKMLEGAPLPALAALTTQRQLEELHLDV